jgi:hypothetical protein
MSLRLSPTLPKGAHLSAVAIVGFLLYASFFIYRTSFVIGGERYFSLFDDAMISMRYAKNLAHGYGLVWNPGSNPVEGYTNPLWVLFMFLIHLLPLPLSKTSLVVQIVATAFLVINLYYVRKIALEISEGSEAVALGAIALNALYLPINNWSLQGMEVSVLVLIVSIALSQALRCMATRTFSISLYILLGVGTWVRPDMVVPFAALLLFLATVDVTNRKRHLVYGSIILVGFCAAQTAFRIWYFGDFLPNTYYLKLTGYPFALRISRGLYVLAQFIWHFNPIIFLIPFALALRRDPRVLLLLLAFVAQMAYSVYVGGDAWEYWGGSNRYICIAMPGFFVLLSTALLRLSQPIAEFLMSDLGVMRAVNGAQGRYALFAFFIAFSIISVNCIRGPAAWAEVVFLKPPLQVGWDASEIIYVSLAWGICHSCQSARVDRTLSS